MRRNIKDRIQRLIEGYRATRSHFSWMSPSKIENDLICQSLSDVSHYARGVLLDVGCGNKPYESLFKEKITTYIGFDRVDQSLIRFLIKVDGIADATKIPIADETVTTILCTQVLEHVTEPWLVMGEFFRVLQPGGYTIITVPQVWRLHLAPHDYYRYTQFGIQFLAESAGFECVVVQPRGGFIAVMAELISTELFYAFGVDRWTEIPVRVLCAVIQLAGAALSKFDKSKSHVLGWTLVARKNTSSPK